MDNPTKREIFLALGKALMNNGIILPPFKQSLIAADIYNALQAK